MKSNARRIRGAKVVSERRLRIECREINYSNVSRFAGIPASSIRAYFEILEETFVGFLLTPWGQSNRRKAVATPKFFLFDVGVANYLRRATALNRNSSEFGKAFEQFVAMEIRSYLSYRRIRRELDYWRTRSGFEVDFVVGSEIAVETTSTIKVTDRDLRGLRSLADENLLISFFHVSFGELERFTADGIRVLH